MFDEAGMSLLRQSSYDILQLNHHDATIHSRATGHDWIIVSNYQSPDCYILHWHSKKDPFHRQHGNYKSLEEAIRYINHHCIMQAVIFLLPFWNPPSFLSEKG